MYSTEDIDANTSTKVYKVNKTGSKLVAVSRRTKDYFC